MLAVLDVETEVDRLAALDPLDDRLAVAELDLDQERVLGPVGDRDVGDRALVGLHAARVADLRALDALGLGLVPALAAGEHHRCVGRDLARVRVATLAVTPVDLLALVALARVLATLVRERLNLGRHGRDAGVDGAGVAVGRAGRSGHQTEAQTGERDGSHEAQPTPGAPTESSLLGYTHVQFSLASCDVRTGLHASGFCPGMQKRLYHNIKYF